MSPIGSILLALVCAAPPLAGAPERLPERAAAPSSLDEIPALDLRRLRLGAGVSYSHVALSAPGGNSLGGGISLAFEGRRLEAALSAYAHGGFAAQDGRARHTGSATSYLRLSGRVVPFPAWIRVMLELGAQVGYDHAFAWCSTGGEQDACDVVPGRLSYAGLAGLVTQLRLDRFNIALGLDALMRGPRSPEVCGPSGCVPSPLGSGRLGLQAWLEAGFGGVAW
jgi:hypothetical protein